LCQRVSSTAKFDFVAINNAILHRQN
jgi:hypothetical protein